MSSNSTPQLENVSLQLGELRGTLVGLRDAIADVRLELQNQRTLRHDMAQSITVLNGKVEILSGSLKAMDGRFDTMRTDMTPLIDLRKSATSLVVGVTGAGSAFFYLFGPELRAAVSRLLAGS